MSYLDVPRIHFGGVFFTDPNTINNVIQLYHEDWSNPPLKQPDGTYTEKLTIDGQPSGRDWNPTGVAQLWLENCKVLSVVGPDGRTFQPGDPDPLTRATIETPSPKTPQMDRPTSYRDIAKMVDIDPDQQGRSEVFGLWVYVKLPEGGGFHALFDRPNLRLIYGPRGSGGFNNGYIQPAGGTWAAKLTNIVWNGDSSPLLQALKERAENNTLQMKLSMDMYERDQRLRYSDAGKGNRFGYGRVMGTIGPCSESEPSQIARGRLLMTPPSTSTRSRADMARNFKKVDIPAAAETAPAGPPWNVAPAAVSTRGSTSYLTIDLGMAIPLINAPAPVGGGKMAASGPLTVGYYLGTEFVRLKNGTIVIDDSSYQQVDAALEFKNAYWMTNSGVYEFELAEGEADKISNAPLGISVKGTPMLAENASGLFFNVEPSCIRMEPNTINTTPRLRIFKFGAPVDDLDGPTGLSNLSLQSVVNQWTQPPGSKPDADWNSNAVPTSDISASLDKVAAGSYRITVKTGPAVPLPVIRQPLDSQVYFVMISPDGGGEGGAPPLTVLFWQNHWVSNDPAWETVNGKTGVGDILKAYSRLYPGMREKLDIGDEEMVKGALDSIIGFMASDFDKPDYMPVVRDLSPTVVDMILNWLGEAQGGGEP